jgi:hypothetical protein
MPHVNRLATDFLFRNISVHIVTYVQSEPDLPRGAKALEEKQGHGFGNGKTGGGIGISATDGTDYTEGT